MELLLPPWEDWPERYRNTDKTEVTEIVIIDSQMNYRRKLDTYGFPLFSLTRSSSFATLGADKRLSTFSSGMSQWGCSEEIQSVAFFLLTPFLTIPNSFCILGIEIANSLPGGTLASFFEASTRGAQFAISFFIASSFPLVPC